MRSSIACTRCRRSKVKCVNNGVNTPCRDCEAKGRECTYPTPAIGGSSAPARQEASITRSTTGSDTHISQSDVGRRSKTKRLGGRASSDVSTRESMRAVVDALDSALLTPRVWTELFEIYRMHFSTDLSFLHAPSFLKPLRQTGASSFQTQDFAIPPEGVTASPMPDAPPLLLLAFLALTARHHPQLITHHSPASSSRPSNPLIAAEYYASACRARLAGSSGEGLGQPELARIQALLMLATHEWSIGQGVKSFVSLGVALRYAQLIGLQYDRDSSEQYTSLSTPIDSPVDLHIAQSRATGQAPRNLADEGEEIINQEIQRRTFWSCFVLDRLLSNGKHRSSMVQSADVSIQLPCSDRAFVFGEPVRTTPLREKRAAHAFQQHSGQPYPAQNLGNRSGERDLRSETGLDEGTLSRYIRTTDIYGQVIQWSCAGGRRSESLPPSNPQSYNHHLHSQVSAMVERLPRDLALSHTNTSAHISSRTSTSYLQLHVSLLLSNIILHRDYLPFLPLNLNQPSGPLDDPVYPPEQVHPTFWQHNAKELFRSARALIDLVHVAAEWNVVVRTPLVGFAIYNVAILGLYSNHFPWMDQDGHLCESRLHPGDGRGVQAARRSIEMLWEFRPSTKLADGWVKTVLKCHRYFSRVKREYTHQGLAVSTPVSASSTFRESPFGQGSGEYNALEKTLEGYANIEYEDIEMPEAESDHIKASSSTAGEGAIFATKGETRPFHDSSADDSTVRPDSWHAINSATTSALPMDPPSSFQQTVQYSAQNPGHYRPTISIDRKPLLHEYSTSASGIHSPSTAVNQSQNRPYQLDYASQHRGSPIEPPSASRMQSLPPVAQLQAAQASPASRHREARSDLPTLSFSGEDVAAFVEGRVLFPTRKIGWLALAWSGS